MHLIFKLTRRIHSHIKDAFFSRTTLCILSLPLSPSLSLTHTHTRTLSLPLSITLSHSLSLSLSLTPSLYHSHSLLLYISLFLSPTLTFSLKQHSRFRLTRFVNVSNLNFLLRLYFDVRLWCFHNIYLRFFSHLRFFSCT